MDRGENGHGNDLGNPVGPVNDLFWQDEILQVMYWLLGEGFASEVTVTNLRRFLDAEPSVLLGNLDRLAVMGLLSTHDAPGSPTAFCLTEAGKEDAKRRFADEFQPYLGRSGHGECSDDCWCQDPAHVGEPCPSTVHKHIEVGM